MNKSRRKFLKAGIVASLFAGIPGTLASPGAAQNPLRLARQLKTTGPLAYYNKEAFAAYLNSDFRITNYGSGKTWVRLILVEDFPTSEALTAPDECFRLLFVAAAETSLPQGTYSFDHAALGSFPLFIVPGKPLDGKVHYEAVFNRRFSSDVGPTAIPNAKQPGKKRPAGWETDTMSAPDSGKQIMRPSSHLKVNY